MASAAGLAPSALGEGIGEFSDRAVLVVGDENDVAGAIRDTLAAGGARLEDERSLERLGGLDILVFVAPRTPCGPIAQTSVAEFTDWLGGGLTEGFLCLQRSVAAMRAKGGGGAVVFVAPPADDHRAFDACQCGLRLLAKAAALELGSEGIRVNVVLPGAMREDPGGTAVPLGRCCTARDVAEAVAFVASERAKFMTGAQLVVDGGRSAQ